MTDITKRQNYVTKEEYLKAAERNHKTNGPALDNRNWYTWEETTGGRI